MKCESFSTYRAEYRATKLVTTQRKSPRVASSLSPASYTAFVSQVQKYSIYKSTSTLQLRDLIMTRIIFHNKLGKIQYQA
jgi:hypothetical protein